MSTENSHFRITLASELMTDSFFHEWTELLRTLSNESFVHQPQWFESYLKAYPENKANTYFITQHDTKGLCAVFPLQYTSTRYFGVRYKTWNIFLDCHMGINDFVYDFKNPARKTILKNLIDFLNTNIKSMPWHILKLQDIPENASISYSSKQFKISRHLSFNHHSSKYISCGSTYDDPIKNISSKFKRNNRRKLRKLEKLGSIHYEMADTEASLNTAFEHFIDVETANWKGKLQSALEYDLQQQEFYRLLMNSFAKTDQCRIHSLWLNNKPIAMQFCLAINDTFHLLKIGYNADYKNISPGNILLSETIRRFSGDAQIKKINFVTGLKWNDNWAPTTVDVYHHQIFNSNFKGSIIYAVEKIKNLLREIKRS